ncbi:hypothetical protein ANASTE_00027 [Anaerofustis stercorihominis DSM 17244]|uniref:Uncharacterized protein n=1 Tax=Anaerofustis stercorihominis DSM 17244 TaxID=445971 RepID=B1C5N9_9FIRM|nr:hypothetical protein [Anaerofustis stercorihominis]EDS73603.1 hypothetical protein ANASTE_00027 [Anaerofustis stercorihominis DSM 17244]
MISLVLGICFSFESVLVFISLFFTVKRVIFNGTHPFLLFLIIFYALACFFIGQLFFYMARRKYKVESIFNVPLLDINIKEEIKLEHIIEGRDIAGIEDGKILYIEDENKNKDIDTNQNIT